MKNDNSCAGATPLAAYADITSVDVETTDRAGTTAWVSAVLGAVVATVVILTSGSSGGGGSAGYAPSAPKAPFRFPSASIAVPTWTGPAFSLDVRGVAAAGRSEGGPVTPLESVNYAKEGPVFSATEIRRANVSALVSVDARGSAFSREGAGGGAKGRRPPLRSRGPRRRSPHLRGRPER